MGILTGKVAVVTGSGQGIGRCVALCLASHGAKLVTNNRKRGSSIDAFENTVLDYTTEERAELQKFCGDAQTTADEIIKNGGEAEPVFGDVSNESDAKRLVDAAVNRWGRIDIIVNNASSNLVGNIADLDVKSWDTQIASKLSGAFYLMHYALPHMKKQGFGRILNSASDAFLGISDYAAYGAGNAGVVALTKGAAADLAGSGVTVNAYTPLARTRSWLNARTAYRVKGVAPEVVEANAPQSMKNTAEGMVPFLAYLASDEAGGITGKLFKLAADGIIGLWSNSQVIKEVKKDGGVWSFDDLREAIPNKLIN